MIDQDARVPFTGSNLIVVSAVPSNPAVHRGLCIRLAALALAAAWGALGYGLFFTTPDEQAWDDLEAGGRFAANFEVYMPYLALTLPVAGALVYGLFARLGRLSPLWTIAAFIALFGAWVITRDYLRVAQPELATWATWCLFIDLCAAVLLIAASALGAIGKRR